MALLFLLLFIFSLLFFSFKDGLQYKGISAAFKVWTTCGFVPISLVMDVQIFTNTAIKVGLNVL